MILPHGAIVAVADGRTLRLFRNAASEPHIHLTELERPSLSASNAGSGLRHHNEAANPDADRKSEDSFAAAMAHLMNKMAHDGALQKIFVIADPRTLGELRRLFDQTLLKTIIGQMPKDLTKHSVEDIAKAVQDS